MANNLNMPMTLVYYRYQTDGVIVCVGGQCQDPIINQAYRDALEAEGVITDMPS